MRSAEERADYLAQRVDALAGERDLFKSQRDKFAHERDVLAAALQELLDAMPTSCEDRRLNEAQAKAETLLKELAHA